MDTRLPFLGQVPPFKTIGAFDTTPRVSGISPNSKRTTGGGIATIIGANFRLADDGTAPVVMFDNVQATNVIVVDLQHLTCTIPAHVDAGLANISVSVGSQTGTAYGVFTYFEGTITSITPSHGPYTGGTEVMIEGFNFLNGSLVLFDGTQATDIVFVDSQHIICKTPNHSNGFVDVVILEPLV